MGTLSNFPWLRALRFAGSAPALSLRAARSDEIEDAVRLILRSPGGQIDHTHFEGLLRLATARPSTLGGIWVAEREGCLLSAILPVVSPGKTMLLFAPFHLQDQQHAALTSQLLQAICTRAAAAGVHLAQALLETDDQELRPLLESCLFRPLAELIYLQTPVSPGARRPTVAAGFRWHTYSRQMHPLFARTVLASYEKSLDCPGLNGLRSIEEILAGHRATGEFDPALWFVLTVHGSPAGVLLLSRVPQSDFVELVYLGLPPEHRGRGIGDILMRQAIGVAAELPCSRLSLAVDAANLPALKLYWRHGLNEVGRKLAMLRDLRAQA